MLYSKINFDHLLKPANQAITRQSAAGRQTHTDLGKKFKLLFTII